MRFILSLVFLTGFGALSAFAQSDTQAERLEQLGRECAGFILKIPSDATVRTNGLTNSQLPLVAEAFTECLKRYIQIQTVNPPGDDGRATKFFVGALDTLGIPYRELKLRGRNNLVASYSLPRPAVYRTWPSIVLYHHMDVVPVFPTQWVKPELTFSGTVAPLPSKPQGPQYIWGRGALDMKSVGIFQLISMALIKQNQIPISKTIYLVAAADEEVGANGAKGILEEIKKGGALEEMMGAEVLLNEGGYGANRRGKALYLIGTEEKGGAWLELKNEDPIRLLNALDESMNLFANLKPAEVNPYAKCVLRSLDTPGQQVNVSPSRAVVELSCPIGADKLSWGMVHSAFQKEFQSVKGLRVNVLKSQKSFRISIELSSSGHGSLGALSALQIAARGLQNLGVLPVKEKKRAPDFFGYYKTPAVAEFLQNIFRLYHIPSKANDWLSCYQKMEQVILKEVGDLAYSERLFRTSCTWTGFNSSAKAGAKALVDCRLIHTGFYREPEAEHAKAFVKEVQSRISENTTQISLITGWNYTASAPTSPSMKTLRDSIRAERPEAFVSAFLTPTSSDSTWFRAPHLVGSTLPPIPSYGYFPVILEDDLSSTIHGSNERFPVSEIPMASKMYFRAVRDLAK